jgi:ribonuclease P/MRP protein subunit RPP1
MYEYHVSGSLSECLDFGGALGWRGMCYVVPHTDFNGEKAAIRRQKHVLDVSLGVLIESPNMNEIRKLVDTYRDRAELVFVKGGDTELNRYVFNMPKVDVVTGVSGEASLDYVMCRLAKKNGIHVEFSFAELLQSYSKSRSRILGSQVRNAAMVRKYGTPFLLTSCALSKWDMRSPHDMMVFGRTLGFQDPEMKDAMSSAFLEENRKKLSGKKIAHGIEKI